MLVFVTSTFTTNCTESGKFNISAQKSFFYSYIFRIIVGPDTSININKFWIFCYSRDPCNVGNIYLTWPRTPELSKGKKSKQLEQNPRNFFKWINLTVCTRHAYTYSTMHAWCIKIRETESSRLSADIFLSWNLKKVWNTCHVLSNTRVRVNN